MYEGIRSPAVHMPRTLNGLISTSTRFPNAIYWAGGTYIMSQKEYYPCRSSEDIISITQIPELKRIYRTEKYLEIGSAVTYEQMLTVGKQALPGLLQATLQQTASRIVRRQITLGGSLCTPNIRLSLPVTLSALKAEVEVKTCLGPKTETRWMEVIRLYGKEGKLLLKSNELVTRIRLGFDQANFFTHLVGGSPMTKPEESVIFSFACHYSQSVIDHFRLCIAFPTSMMIVPHEVNLIMHGTILPLSTGQIDRVVRSVMEEIASTTEREILPIQLERAKRFIESTAHELNAKSLLSR